METLNKNHITLLTLAIATTDVINAKLTLILVHFQKKDEKGRSRSLC